MAVFPTTQSIKYFHGVKSLRFDKQLINLKIFLIKINDDKFFNGYYSNFH